MTAPDEASLAAWSVSDCCVGEFEPADGVGTYKLRLPLHI